MKLILSSLIAFAIATLGPSAFAASKASIDQEFEALGGNSVILEKAKALNPDKRVEVVQNRIVDRRHRIEFAPEYQNILGGDPYTRSQSIGLNLHYHFTPHWSAGVKYGYYFNELRPEGESLMDNPQIGGNPMMLDLFDYPKSQYMALAHWYPFYGKLNLYDFGVAHFDVYALAGVGQVELKSGRTPTYTGGGGVGFWFSPGFTLRTELRYQSYTAKNFSGERRLNTTVLGVQFGYLL